MWIHFSPSFSLGEEQTVGSCQGKGKHRLKAGGLRAGVYVLDFFPCLMGLMGLMGLAATAGVRFSGSLTQDWRAFCCSETMVALSARN